MSFTAYATWVAGSILTAAQLNQQLRDNGLILKTSIADDGRISGEIKYHRQDPSTVSISAGTASYDVSLFNSFKTTLNANITTFTVTGWTASKAQTVVIKLTQDGTGSRTVAFPAGWKWAGGSAPTMTATANKTDIVTLYSDDGGSTIFAAMFTQNA